MFALRRANGVVAVSNALKSKIESFGISADKIKFIPTVAKQNFNYKYSEDINMGKKKILFVGQIIPRKGIQDLVKAVAIICKNGVDVEVDVVGQGFYYNEVKKLLEKEGIATKFNFIGPVSHAKISKFMASADILCLPSYREGWPNVCVEALSMGLPVVATDIGGTNEIIANGDLGILVKPGDYNALADAIKDALSKKWDRAKIREYARRFSGEDMARHYNEVYMEARKRHEICN